MNLLVDKEFFENEIMVKIRSTGKLIRIKIKFKKEYATLNLLEDEYGICRGQACVFYSKDKMDIKF